MLTPHCILSIFNILNELISLSIDRLFYFMIMPPKESYLKMLTELVCQSKDGNINGSLLTNRHVQHLSVTAEEFLRMYASFKTVAIALPPLVCNNWYHCLHVNIGERRIVYHEAVHACSYFREVDQGPCHYSKRAAMKNAEDMWGHDFPLNWSRMMPLENKQRTELADVIHETQDLCEPLELEITDATETEDEELSQRAIEKQMRRLKQLALRVSPIAHS
jgi:hypothetical protein